MAHLYEPTYRNSWALAIGINAYRTAGKLAGAVNDAKAVSNLLIERFAFPKSNVTLLTDEAASKEAILKAYLAYRDEKVGPDDRLVVFYAGHGHTETGRRGEIGFLVPVEGNPSNLETLIRWDELPREAHSFHNGCVLWRARFDEAFAGRKHAFRKRYADAPFPPSTGGRQVRPTRG
jgi:hypothetical protein